MHCKKEMEALLPAGQNEDWLCVVVKQLQEVLGEYFAVSLLSLTVSEILKLQIYWRQNGSIVSFPVRIKKYVDFVHYVH